MVKSEGQVGDLMFICKIDPKDSESGDTYLKSKREKGGPDKRKKEYRTKTKPKSYHQEIVGFIVAFSISKITLFV